MSHQVIIMYLGRIVESGEATSLSVIPKHPHAQALFAAALPNHPDEKREDFVLTAEVPSPLRPPPGWLFPPRCPRAMDRCSREASVPRAVEDRLISRHPFD